MQHLRFSVVRVRGWQIQRIQQNEKTALAAHPHLCSAKPSMAAAACPQTPPARPMWRAAQASSLGTFDRGLPCCCPIWCDRWWCDHGRTTIDRRPGSGGVPSPALLPLARHPVVTGAAPLEAALRIVGLRTTSGLATVAPWAVGETRRCAASGRR